MPVSTLTIKYQATIPRQVREALQLAAGDRVEFVVARKAVTVRKFVDPDLAEARADDAAFAPEWLSAADEEAWRDL
jgi:AbrB family looped-hinge helix DNA binding protein